MLRSVLTYVRRLIVVVTALVLVVAPSSLALAQSPPSSRQICVARGSRVLHAVNSSRRCAKGERSFVVNGRGAQGRRGATGARGVPGATGSDGVTGATGPTAARGATGALGPQGSSGTTGANGTDGAPGSQGIPGSSGTNGTNGALGSQGIPGTNGALGSQGIPGTSGTNGTNGAPGSQGIPGTSGTNGTNGTDGAVGAQGPAGPVSTLAFAEFYAVMPSDNAATVASGSRLLFPQDGPMRGGIVRVGNSFVLPTAGMWRLAFAASITEAGQLQLYLNDTRVSYGAFGRATGTSQIAGEAFVTTTAAANVDVRNSSAGVVTLTPLAGGPQPVTSFLTIQQLG